MQKNIKHIVFALMLLLSLFGGFLLGRHSRVANEPIVVTEVTRDTIIAYMPKEIERRVLVNDTIAVITRDTLWKVDTLYLPREQKVYADSSYRAVVSGISPRLDSIEVYNKTIVETKIATQKEWRKFDYGVQVGVGLVCPVNSTPNFGGYVGFGLTYHF